MSIVYNNTTIDTVKYNNTNIDTVKYNGTEVYVSTRTLTVNAGTGIDSAVINGNTYTSITTTVNIKPGTTVTLNCNIRSTRTNSNGLTTAYSFINWAGYTTETNKSFTFTMPNSNITYTANIKVTQTFNWPSSGNIPESTFLYALESGASNRYNTSLVGRTVTLTEDSSTHDWLIIRVNTYTYDLWYKGSIGIAKWKGPGTDRYWTNNSSTDTKYVRGLCTSYKSKLSSDIQNRLKLGLNANCGNSDRVVILSCKQLGGTYVSVTNDSNSAIPYFNSNDRRKIGSYYWTTSTNSDNSNVLWSVKTDGYFDGLDGYNHNFAVVPAIRVG